MAGRGFKIHYYDKTVTLYGSSSSSREEEGRGKEEGTREKEDGGRGEGGLVVLVVLDQVMLRD